MTHPYPPSMGYARLKRLCKKVQNFPVFPMMDNPSVLFLIFQIISLSFNPFLVSLVCRLPVHSLNYLKYSDTVLSICPSVFSASVLGTPETSIALALPLDGSINGHN